VIGAPATIATGVAVVVVAGRLRPHAGRAIDADASEPSADLVGRIVALRSRRHEQRVPRPRDVAAWCDHLARQIRSGMTLHETLTTTVPADPATRRCTETIRRQLGRGRQIAEILDERDAVASGTHLDLAIGVIAMAARLGGSPAPAIDRTASVLRQRAADDDERVAQAAQARLSAHVLTAIPLLMLAALLVTDADVRAAVRGPIGSMCIGLGLGLNTVGSVWMRRIVSSTP
jgi:Flp pilus assembly protein TadB